jgi:hypothetical protein
LYDKIKDIDSKITFWLDSHWSGTPDVGCDSVTICPLLEELEQIKQHSNTHTIMINDIRLMNNSDNKYEGFPIKIEQILTKLYEINPNYQIKYFDDYCAKNDILVAYIQNVCVHKYLTKCITNPQPPGFADFLRGTIAFYIFAKKYDYTLSIDRSHPVFHYLKGNEHTGYTGYTGYTEELLPPLTYQNIYSILENKFKSKKSFSIMTNSFYNLQHGILTNYGEITPDCANYMKDLLSPTLEVENKLSYVFNEVYKINGPFNVIHLRFGDIFIENNIYNDQMYDLYYNKINTLMEKMNEKYVLISDSVEIAKKLKTNIPELLYWDNTKIHLGSLTQFKSNDIMDTIVDFFIISKSNEIFSNGSGFSNINSIIYNIKYNLL